MKNKKITYTIHLQRGLRRGMPGRYALCDYKAEGSRPGFGLSIVGTFDTRKDAEKFLRASLAGERKPAARFMAAVVPREAGFRQREGQWYIVDGLTHEPFETNPRKGWYKRRKQCEAACDKLNIAEVKAGRWYAELPNGYVMQVPTK
jgi:hypothetical protein